MAVYRDGKGYRARVSIPNGDGTYSTISTRRRTSREAKRAEMELLARKGKAKGGMDLDALAAACFADLARKRKRTTVDAYEVRWRKNISPFIGKVDLGRVTKETIEGWKRRLVQERPDIGHSYLHMTWTVLHLVMAYGRRMLGLSMDPLDMVGDFEKDPNAVVESDPLEFWTAEEFERVNAQAEIWMAEASPLSAQWMIRRSVWIEMNILFYAGLRKGEANALMLSDWHDGEHPYLSVTKTVNLKLMGKGNPLVTPPKTRGSVRRVPVPGILASRIRRHVAAHLSSIDAPKGRPLLLCGGIDYVKDSTLAKTKEDMERIAGVPHIRVHGLRHSYVSMLINAGADPMKVSKLIGDTFQMVLQVYGHLYRSTLEDVVALIDAKGPQGPAAGGSARYAPSDRK